MTKEELRIVFFGTPDFAVESLRRLVEGGYNIVGVVTMPDKPAGRGHRMLQSAVKQYAVEKGLHLMQPERLKDKNFVNELQSLNAQLNIVIAFRMLPEVVWAMPPFGTFNLHASLLPKYRGAAPINWAVMNGDNITGVTTFFLKHEIDTGDIIQQKSIEIGRADNVETVHDRLMTLGAGMVIETVNAIIAGTVKPIPQEQMLTAGEQPTPAPKIFTETCRVDWNWPAEKVYNHIRGLSPYPAAWSEIVDGNNNSSHVKIFATSEPIDKSGAVPGTIVTDGKHLIVDCADGAVEILSLQLAGKRRMPAADFMRGFNVADARFQ